MKATLEFNLPEDETYHRLATRAMDWWSVVYEHDQQLRNELKYGTELHVGTLETVRKWLHEKLDERNLSLDDIT